LIKMGLATSWDVPDSIGDKELHSRSTRKNELKKEKKKLKKRGTISTGFIKKFTRKVRKGSLRGGGTEKKTIYALYVKYKNSGGSSLF